MLTNYKYTQPTLGLAVTYLHHTVFV